LDVVPAEYPEAFKPSIKKGRIYGRGAGDMKGVVAAMMELIKDKEIRKTSTGLLLTTDEEIG